MNNHKILAWVIIFTLLFVVVSEYKNNHLNSDDCSSISCISIIKNDIKWVESVCEETP